MRRRPAFGTGRLGTRRYGAGILRGHRKIIALVAGLLSLAESGMIGNCYTGVIPLLHFRLESEEKTAQISTLALARLIESAGPVVFNRFDFA